MSSDERSKHQEEASKRMDTAQYNICFNSSTERPFTGAYWNHKGNGHYDCAVCGERLFDSQVKFDSGTGWPSFWDAEGNIAKVVDKTLGMTRTEVKCGKCGCHLGHVFEDGPQPTGFRYCINSASLDFKERKQ
ncbi:Peptide methionine sulfoxide reductase MsrB [Paramicrosporidium saccamoebae]|uniref:Peptide-methionine (R)-S-oxide reductase n=1 Tax=Paramicrosporidium saccamoebae TaxID=1246581 RepID=A0A2H9TQH9_9FUNG|nr:Peptide methionine sulfoxide reductase MsrB [Paramicrosporidium saccamoebae]